MKKYIALLLIAAGSIMQAVVVDKITISNGNIIAYSHGARHMIKAKNYGKAMKAAFQENPNARWRSFSIGSKTYTMSHPTAQWACSRLNEC